MAFVIAKIATLACNIRVVFVNANLITQNVLNISYTCKLAHGGVETTISKLQTLTADTVCCVWTSHINLTVTLTREIP